MKEAVSCRGKNLLKLRPGWSPLGVKFKISDEHPLLFHMGVPPPPRGTSGEFQIKDIPSVPFILSTIINMCHVAKVVGNH